MAFIFKKLIITYCKYCCSLYLGTPYTQEITGNLKLANHYTWLYDLSVTDWKLKVKIVENRPF